MKHYDAVVIGAGNGGIGTALALTNAGVKTLVLEKHNLPGGCATSFVRGRFEYDASLHAMFYDVLFKNVWENQFHITSPVTRVPDIITVAYTDTDGKNVYMDLPLGARELVMAIEKEIPGSAPVVQQYLGLCGEVLGAAQFAKSPDFTPELMQEKFPHFQMLMKMTAQEVFDYLEMPMNIQAIFNNLWWYLGPKIDEFPFFRYAPVVMMLVTMPTYFPNHACHGYLAEMETKIRENGGDVWLNTEVTEIVTKDGKVCGVKTNHGDYIETTQVIADISPRIVLEDLIKEDSPKRQALLEKQKDITENFSFTIIYLGLNKSAEELGIKAHHLFIADAADAKETYEASRGWEGPYCIGALCPNVTVKDFSPEGTCVLSLSVPMLGSALEGMTQEEYFKAKDEFAQKIIKTTGEHLGIDLFDCIEEISIATPATLSRYAGVRSGALGYARTFADIRKNEAATAQLNGGNPEEVYEGLSFVGQFAFGIGYQTNVTGIPVAMKVAQTIKGGN